MSNVTTLPLVSTPPTLTDTTPGFFEILPRELRDNVYDLLYDELDDNDSSLRYQTHTARTELRLVSRQFKLEYEERTSVDKQSRHLTVSANISHSCWCEIPVTLPWPRLASRILHLTLVITFCDGEHSWNGEIWECNADEDGLGAFCYFDFAKALVDTLPCLQSLRVRLHAAADLCVMQLLESYKPFTTSPRLTEFKIMGPGPEGRTTTHPAQVAVWTEQDGLQQDEEAVEMCCKRALPQQLE